MKAPRKQKPGTAKPGSRTKVILVPDKYDGPEWQPGGPLYESVLKAVEQRLERFARPPSPSYSPGEVDRELRRDVWELVQAAAALVTALCSLLFTVTNDEKWAASLIPGGLLMIFAALQLRRAEEWIYRNGGTR